MPRLVLELALPHTQSQFRSLFLNVERPLHEVEHSAPAPVQVESRCCSTSTPPTYLHSMHRDNSTFNFTFCLQKSSLSENWASSCSRGSSASSESSMRYVVYKQPLSLDRFFIHDVTIPESASCRLEAAFVLVSLNRFQQVVTIHTFQAPSDQSKVCPNRTQHSDFTSMCLDISHVSSQTVLS